MNVNEPQSREWLGVIGAGAIAAAITALGMPWFEHDQSLVDLVFSSAAAADTFAAHRAQTSPPGH